MKTCETCRWWIRGQTRKVTEQVTYEAAGQCRRLPPSGGQSRWPLTERGDWCGEHSQLHPQENGPSTGEQARQLELSVDRARPATVGQATAQPAGAPAAKEGDPQGGTPSARRGRSGPRFP